MAKSRTSKRKLKQSSKKKTILIGLVVIILIAILGIIIVYTSRASSNYLILKSYNNTDSSVLKTVDVKQTSFGSGRNKTEALYLESGPTKDRKISNVKYEFNLLAGKYRLCQNGSVATTNAILGVGLIADNKDFTGGTIKKSLKKSKGNRAQDLYCLEFEIAGKYWEKSGKVEYFVGLEPNEASTSGVYLTKMDLYVNNDLVVSDKVLQNELHVGEKCTGDNIIEGQITDQLGNPVPAHIGIDYEDETSTNTGYEKNAYVNISKPQEQNTYWCKTLPSGVKRASIEIYSQRTYDSSDQIANNYLRFGNAMKHSVDVKGKGKTNVNLVLPNTCNSPGIPANIANTGRVIIKEIKVNDEAIDIEPKPDRLDNNLWRTNAWSRNLDPGVTIAGFSSLNTRKENGKTLRADIIGRLASRQKYLIKAQVSRKNHDYKFEVPGVYVDPCGDTSMKVQITDKIYGDYDSKLTCVARVNPPSKKEETINCSSIVEEPNKSRNSNRDAGESE